jgi:hypothetical protein
LLLHRGPGFFAAGVIAWSQKTHSRSQIFPITGKLTGSFRDSRKKTAFSAQIPQFLPQEQGLTGNLQLSAQVL